MLGWIKTLPQAHKRDEHESINEILLIAVYELITYQSSLLSHADNH